MEKFLNDITKEHMPKLIAINTEIDDLLRCYNEKCFGNIDNIFSVLETSEFEKLIIEYGSTFIIESKSLFMFDKSLDKKIRDIYKKYSNIPLARYYWKAYFIDNYNPLPITVKIGLKYIEINTEKFYSEGDLYNSNYRFLFNKFSYTEFKHCIEKILGGINVAKY